MLELLGMGIAAAAGLVGYARSRRFVRRRLRYTTVVEKPWFGVAAGAAAAGVAAPVVALLPLVGAGTALLFAVGVGVGAAAGARDTKRPLLEE